MPRIEAGGIAIRVVGIAKAFGTTSALRDVSLAIEPGELLALLGPSGSGKTTLLRAIAGLETPDEGEVYFGEENATAIPVQKRRVGFVFQHYALFKHLTVADNIAYGLRTRPRADRPPAGEIRRRVSDLLDLVQLGGLERRFPAQLSGGQRQRVALARALAVEPRVLLLDEPFGALDAKVRKDLRRWLRDIHARTGQTTVFVTHDQDEALELADRVAILNDGRIEQVGTPVAVHDRPATPFVMSFVGDATRFEGIASHGTVALNGRALPVTVPDHLSGPVAVFCRPWHFVATQAPDALFQGTVTVVRRLGGVQRVELDLDGGGRAEVELTWDQPVSRGARLGLGVSDAHVFGAG